jgi:hypothetical protein
MNKFNFISKQLSLHDLVVSTDHPILYSSLISSVHDWEKFSLQSFHFAEVYRKKKINFSVCLDFSADQPVFFETILKKTDLFIRAFFHPNFKRSGNKPIIFIVGSTESERYLTEFISSFNAIAALNGFDGIEWIYLQKWKGEKNVSANCLYEYTNASAFEDTYYQLLKETSYVGNYIGIINNSGELTTDILKGKSIVEQKFKNNFPHQSAILEKYVWLENEMPLLKRKLELVSEELKNQQLYLALLRAGDEANKINNFYYNEYEILPSWYKKLGHIIKVLLGKRTFKSLYDSNVKKYKN